MGWWDRLRKRRDSTAGDWVAAGSPLPDEATRVEGLAFELAQVLWIQGRRGPAPWPERLALVERILTSPRWAEAGYEWRSSDGHGRVTGPDGALLVELRHDPASDGQVIDRYQQGRMVQRNRFDERGRELR
jgi:hypothetical protein